MEIRDQHHLVTFSSSVFNAPLITELLATTPLQTVSWTKHGGEQCRFEIYTESPEEAQQARHDVAQLLAAAEVPLLDDFQLHTLKREDWEHFWKRFFHVDKVSARMVIRPSWETYEAKAGEQVIDMDPGMSFGTGQHGTTRACIQFLDQLAGGGSAGSLLDAGCGSGILAIAGAKLGYGPIRAFDYDADAVAIAVENAENNGCTTRIALDTADVFDLPPHPQYDVVVANILAPVLIEAAPRLVAALAPHGGARLILAGILHAQYPAVRERFESLGLLELQTRQIDEWTSGMLCFRDHAGTSR
jgi:ribosomal protein L11 methyltransferase